VDLEWLLLYELLTSGRRVLVPRCLDFGGAVL
jgi:hypothetical protein